MQRSVAVVRGVPNQLSFVVPGGGGSGGGAATVVLSLYALPIVSPQAGG